MNDYEKEVNDLKLKDYVIPCKDPYIVETNPYPNTPKFNC